MSRRRRRPSIGSDASGHELPSCGLRRTLQGVENLPYGTKVAWNARRWPTGVEAKRLPLSARSGRLSMGCRIQGALFVARVAPLATWGLRAQLLGRVVGEASVSRQPPGLPPGRRSSGRHTPVKPHRTRASRAAIGAPGWRTRPRRWRKSASRGWGSGSWGQRRPRLGGEPLAMHRERTVRQVRRPYGLRRYGRRRSDRVSQAGTRTLARARPVGDAMYHAGSREI